MKLKNTDELRRRAKAHQRMDNFLAGTYGKNAVGGDPSEIRACGVGCLAAPHQKGRFATLMERIGVGGMWSEKSERQRLAKEFGICEALTYSIEYGFEYAHHTNADRADFIVAVTEAMADGVEIRPREAEKWHPMSAEARREFIRWLAEKCDRPVPRYAREAVAA